MNLNPFDIFFFFLLTTTFTLNPMKHIYTFCFITVNSRIASIVFFYAHMASVALTLTPMMGKMTSLKRPGSL